MAKNNEKTLLLRLPRKIHKEVKTRAEKNQRSVNSQIIFELGNKLPIITKEEIEQINSRIKLKDSIITA